MTQTDRAADFRNQASGLRQRADELEASTDPAVLRPCPRPQAYRELADDYDARALALESVRRYLLDGSPVTWAELAEVNEADTMAMIGAIAVGGRTVIGACDEIERLADAVS